MSTHNIPFFNTIKENTLNYPNSAVMGFFSWGLKNEFKRAVVNEPSVFEPLKFCCIVERECQTKNLFASNFLYYL